MAILTTGRFHVCDLARELDALGHDVAFYSLVPPWRTRRFGLPDRCTRWLGPHLAPFVLATRAMRGTVLEVEANESLAWALDRLAARLVSRCDVLIGMSGMSNATAEAARRKYGAKIFIERGSRHILSQREILESIPGRATGPPPVTQVTVRRELDAYALADVIVVPAKHVVRSFVERGVADTRLFRNPYGVSLDKFLPTVAPDPDPPRMVMAGTWSLRKGCDLIARAWRDLPGVLLTHVGPVGDVELPASERFEHLPSVDQPRLVEVYARGHVFVLASREEGLALVQAQALASGLALVCTDRTGGEDLKELLADPDVVTVVPSGDAVRLASALGAAIELAQRLSGPRDLLGVSRANLSWRAYGERYDRELRERT